MAGAGGRARDAAYEAYGAGRGRGGRAGVGAYANAPAGRYGALGSRSYAGAPAGARWGGPSVGKGIRRAICGVCGIV
ncbi:hypothetical protein GCM10023324_15980 [Streptomyces youssoufiensis]